MGKMSTISYLASEGKLDELMEEVIPIAKMMGKTPKEVAEGFIEAQEEIDERQSESAYKVLHELSQRNIAQGRQEQKKGG